ncbi:MAG TPA: patatin-like phospholipase family protein [Candidatus Dormibacteraeota bacterium]|nr:patatin-like phospholipase family protein [Candidatus Dormibacteraeota bacterium]
MTRPVRVLSVDGGGIRGIIPALVLAELERRTGRPVCRLFDVLAGTSTGGLLALGLALPDGRGEPVMRTEHVIEMYEKAGQNIFVRDTHNPWHALLHERYNSDHIDGTLNRFFGDTPISAATVDVLVTSYDLLNRDVYLLSTWNAREDPSHDVPMRIAARATSAAPTYFEPVAVRTGEPAQDRLLIDGGVCANNPAMCAYAEVQRRNPGAEVLVVSLGTGDTTRAYPHHEVRDWGLAHWARVILHVVIDGASEMTHLQMRELLQPARYVRMQVELQRASDHLDDASDDNVDLLRAEAARLIAERDRDLDQLAALLTA